MDPADGKKGAGEARGARAADLVEEYLKTLRRRRTRFGYKHELRGFFGDEAVTPERARAVSWKEIADHLKERAGKRAEATVARRLAVLQSFFRWLLEEERFWEEERF